MKRLLMAAALLVLPALASAQPITQLQLPPSMGPLYGLPASGVGGGGQLVNACLTWPLGTNICEDAVNVLSQRNSTAAQRLNVFNTHTSSTNNEPFSVDWQTTANVALVGTRTGSAGGSIRALRLVSQTTAAGNDYAGISIARGGDPFVTFFGPSAASGALVSTAAGGEWFKYIGQSNATSGPITFVSITPTYNQSSGTAANTDWLVKRTPTALGSGRQLFIDTQLAAATSMFSVTAGSTGVATQVSAAQQTVPTCSANCGTSPSVVGSDTAMRVTMGGSGVPASGWVVTFNGTWLSAPACHVTMAKTGMVIGKMALTVVTSTTTITVVTNGTAPATTDVYNVTCIGVQ